MAIRRASSFGHYMYSMEINRTLTNLVHAFHMKNGGFPMAWTIDRNQKLDEKMRELIDESATPDELGDASDVSALLERMSGLSLAEMDSSIRELQKARNFLLNERERLRLEIAEHLRLTKAALGSARAVSASIGSFADGVPARNVGSAPGRREAA
jgi:hypothetical protein